MKTILEMRAKRATLVNEARALHERSVTENRDMAGDEQAQYDRIMGEVDALKAKIDREERLLAENQEMESRTDRQVPGQEQRGGHQEEQRDNKEIYKKEFRNFLIGGMDAVAPEHRSMFMENRALATGTNTAGGFTVPTDFYNSLIGTIKTFGGVRNVARELPTAGGNTLLIPTENNRAQKGRILAENAAAATSDPAFGQTSLGAYKYTSDIILVPIELIQDSAFDVEAFVRERIAERIARITNEHFTIGTGSAQPQGIVTASVMGKTGVAGQTTSVTADDLVDLEHSVDPAYRQRAGWMFHDQTLKALKKLKDGQGRFLWSAGLTVGAPDQILGYNYTINQDMAQMTASAKSILFGDMGSYWIRDVMDVSMVRFGEKYMDAAQIGFVAFSRHDGKFINAGGNQIVHYANSAT